jgi:uncharacterized protein (TIGR02145 family)
MSNFGVVRENIIKVRQAILKSYFKIFPRHIAHMKKLILLMVLSVFIISLHAQLIDSIIDSRDGQKYKIVKIGEQWWMQENLNIGNRISSSLISADNDIIEKYCYNNSETNCDTYGGLYQWNEMMDYNPSDNGNPGTTRGICPAGWHVPTDEEWKELEMYLGMTQAEADLVNTWRGTGVGTKLGAGGGSGYEALYSGRCSSFGSFLLLGDMEYIWTSTECITGEYGDCAWRRCLDISANNVGRWNTFSKTYAFSVRCVRNICLIEEITLEATHINCNGGSDGEIDLVVQGSGVFKYQWSTGDTIEDLTGLPAGYYKVTVTDSNGCSLESEVVLIEPDPILITADYTSRINPDSSNGYIDLNVSGGTAPYNFIWSNGSTSQELTDLDTGNYSVKIIDSHGCKDSASFDIKGLAKCPGEQICIVTVDTTSGKNLVIWEKTDDTCIRYYKIYREDTLIGSIEYNELSMFKDMEANPKIKPYKYQISVIDTCGNESYLSPYHKPLFLVITRSEQGISLEWNDYEIDSIQLTMESYTVYRGSDSNSLFPLVENLHINFFTDPDPLALEGKFYYRVAGILTNPCYPTDSAGTDPDLSFMRTFSNLEDNQYSTNLRSIPEIQVIVHPNPFKDITTIQFPNPEKARYQLSIIDLTGKIVRKIYGINSESIELYRDGLPAGLYLIELRGHKIYRVKIVIE